MLQDTDFYLKLNALARSIQEKYKACFNKTKLKLDQIPDLNTVPENFNTYEYSV